MSKLWCRLYKSTCELLRHMPVRRTTNEALSIRYCQKPDFRTPVWLDRQRSSSVSALLRRRSLALGLLSQLTGAGNTSLRNVYGMSPQRSPSVLCCRLARSSAQDSDVFFVAFSIAVDLKLKVCLLLCCLLDRGRSQAQGISSSLLPSRSRSISSSRYVVIRSVAAPFCGCVKVGVWREIIDCLEKYLQTSYYGSPFISAPSSSCDS